MEAAMVNAFSGAMGSVLSKLTALLTEDLNLAMGVKKDIISLRDELSTMNASLMVLSEMEEPMDAAHRELRDRVRELAYDMEDCLDVSTHRLGDPRGRAAAGLLGELRTLGARSKIATLIRDLKDRVAALGDRYKVMLQLPAAEHRRPRAVRVVDPRIRALYADAASLQGIAGPREKLVEMLQDGTPQLKVVSIVGFGGIGKTTLASQVYTAIRDKYDRTAFVSVSRAPNLAKILSGILRHFEGGSDYSGQDDESESELIDSLRMWMEDQRYLIVIDDIWTTETWNILKCCFIDNNRGSRVITTTRAEDTAKECSSGHGYVYRIKPLGDVDSRRLFYRRIFDSEDACPEQLKCISNEILKKCGGLPLAIHTIGGLLASQREVHTLEIWEKIMHSLPFHLETSRGLEWLRHVFNLGYNDLSLDLKTCMLYLGIFPEDEKIRKADLLRRWIAEGFITERHGDCQEEIAESYINELINRNMIQIAEFDDCGDVLSVRVHDLLLEYIILKCTEENFITHVNDKRSTKGSFEARRLSVQARSSESCAVLENMALTQARSFNLWGPAQRLPSLKKFRLLRVLHLDILGSKDRQQYDMSSVSSLFQLRYFRIRGISCEKLLRTQLHKLEQLRTLDVSGEGGYFTTLDARMLPSTLQHLNIQLRGTMVGGIGQLRDLRTLCEFRIVLEDAGTMKELGELTNLRELELYHCWNDRGDTCDVLLSSLCRLSNLRSLVITGPAPLDVDPDFLSRWSPPPRQLRRLHLLEACTFSAVPADLLAHLGGCLSSLEIRVLSLPSDGAGVLARLTSLVHLTLHVDKEEGVVVLRRAAFPSLRELWFRCEAPCLAFEEGTMPRLRSLVIECQERGTRHTDGVLDGIEHLGSLDELKVLIFEYEDFSSRYVRPLSGRVGETRIEELPRRRWDGRSLEAALKEAISRHPGSLRVVIQEV